MASEETKGRLIPCDAPAIEHNVVEGSGGWVSTPWKKGEKEAYKQAALFKWDVDDRYLKR